MKHCVINPNFSRERQPEYVMCPCFTYNLPVETFPVKNWERFDPVKFVKVLGIFSDSIPKPQLWLESLNGQCASPTCSELPCKMAELSSERINMQSGNSSQLEEDSGPV